MAMEKSLRMKAEALRDDENVFDVSFEGMGTVEATASATDVKVRGNLLNTAAAALMAVGASASAVTMHLWHLGPGRDQQQLSDSVVCSSDMAAAAHMWFFCWVASLQNLSAVLC
jgi:hypothetical protein